MWGERGGSRSNGAARWSFRARLLALTAALFAVLVALRVHGSSISIAAEIWAPGAAGEHFVASPLLRRMSPEAAKRWRPALMAEARYIRIDEWAHETLWALSQLSHEPRFPVVNSHYGDGQNMLLLPWIPVWHPSALARPMTWGYLLLGAQRGLAWAWWSQLLAGFVGIFLLLERIEPRRPWLAVLGAGWFCASAYVVCWSLWPAYVAGLGAGCVAAAVWMLQTERRAVALGCGAAFALCFSGFVMQLYPPWQVPLGYTFLAVFAGLAWRERWWRAWAARRAAWLGGLAVAAAVLGLVLGTFLASSWEALLAFASSDYPGQRRLLGGDTPAWQLFGGFYNFFTMDWFTKKFNPSEAAGFFLLFPAVALAALASGRVRSRLGPVVWSLAPVMALLFAYCVTELPAWLASGTLLGMAQGFRTQIALGLMSIIVCVRMLAVTSDEPLDRRSVALGVGVFSLCGALYLWQGLELQAATALFGDTELPLAVVVCCAVAATLSALLALGRVRLFAALLFASLAVTSATFNPLSIGFADWRSSELSRAVRAVTAEDPRPGGRPSLWLTYGGVPYPNNGIVAQLMGARALAGVYEYPQTEFWAPLDPDGSERTKYNRYLNVRLAPAPPGDRRVRFDLLTYLMVRLTVSPLHPALYEMGARHVLSFGNPPHVGSPAMKLLYRSQAQGFAIWELPPPPR